MNALYICTEIQTLLNSMTVLTHLWLFVVGIIGAGSGTLLIIVLSIVLVLTSVHILTYVPRWCVWNNCYFLL